MELKKLPVNTCPLCRQAALDQSSDQWTCDFCGCRMEFDPASRRTRITYWPTQYALYKEQVGSDWMSRRELFERIDAAAVSTPEQRQPKLVGPLLIIASALILLCVMLGAVASALVISPSIAYTRRVISQAYRPTATATITPTETLAGSMVITTPEQPILTSPISNELTTTPAVNPAVVITATVPVTVVATPTPLPTPALPTPTAPQAVAPQPQPAQPLPPTFTPPPPTLTPPPIAPSITPTVAGAQTSPVATPTQTPPPTQAAPVAGQPTVTPTVPSSQPIQPGSQLFVGTVQVIRVEPNGNASLNEADEYVELRNVGQTPAYLDGWRLKAIRNADNVQLDEYTFPSGSVIAANQTCRIYTNLPFGAENCGFANGYSNDQPLWPVNGARAELYNNQNQLMSRFVY